MLDVVIAGAGPSGAVAALTLARAGARVLVVDREPFPRDKLCGDTLNPGAVRLLASMGLTGGPLASARPLRGMRVTSARAAVDARYPGTDVGLAIRRRALDAWLLGHAIDAGARFESGLVVRGPLMDDSPAHGPVVRGLVLSRRGGEELRLPASITIGADGRRSVLARRLGLVARSDGPRRWAFGTYAADVAGITDLGEMHIRAGAYIGLAGMPDGSVNVCVVTGPRPEGRTPLDVIRRIVERDPQLSPRLRSASFDGAVRVLGPLAADVPVPGTEGLLLSGDAAGFVDPMTGDGLHLAIRSGLLAAAEALVALEHGDLAGAVVRLTHARARAFAAKLRFNRLLRRLVGSPAAVDLASVGAVLAPGIVRHAIRYAGDAA